MNTCATCKHWHDKPNNDYDKTGLGVCRAIVLIDDPDTHETALEWLPDTARSGRNIMCLKPDVTALAFVEGRFHEEAWLLTLADFGCKMHAEKEPA